jgi:hypothetical protein
MPAHFCINFLDPYAEQEVLVTYDEDRPLAVIKSVVDDGGYDLLPDLSEACVRILQLEIAVYRGQIEPYAWAQHAVDVLAAPTTAQKASRRPADTATGRSAPGPVQG